LTVKGPGQATLAEISRKADAARLWHRHRATLLQEFAALQCD